MWLFSANVNIPQTSYILIYTLIMILRLEMTLFMDCNYLLEEIILHPILSPNLFVEWEMSTIDPHILIPAIIYVCDNQL